ncbi:protein FAM193A [Ixodes scapularis]
MAFARDCGSIEVRATLLPPKAVLNRKEARKENGIRLTKCSQNNNSSSNTASSCNSCVVSIAELGDKVRPSLGGSPCPRVSSGSATSPVSNGRTPTTSISGNVFIIGGPSLPLDSSLEKGDASKMAAEKAELTVKAVPAAAAPSRNLFKKLPQNGQEAEVTVMALPSNHQRSSVAELLPTVKKDLCIAHQLNGAQFAHFTVFGYVAKCLAIEASGWCLNVLSDLVLSKREVHFQRTFCVRSKRENEAWWIQESLDPPGFPRRR